LYDCGENEKERAKCILAYLSMDVPRTWWERALSTGECADDYADILHGLLEDVMKLPELDHTVDLAVLIAVAFVDDEAHDGEDRFATVHSRHTLEEYLAAARVVLEKRPELIRLASLIDKKRPKRRRT
jgi:hypothetical protein